LKLFQTDLLIVDTIVHTFEYIVTVKGKKLALKINGKNRLSSMTARYDLVTDSSLMFICPIHLKLREYPPFSIFSPGIL